MARQYHLTPEGPRVCKVDPTNPNSRGCPLGGMHFDQFDDAMAVYTENLRETFGDFHVLVRPSLLEHGRRVSYRGLDAVETVAANPQVRATVSSLKTIVAKGREALEEIRGHYRGETGSPLEQPQSLPEEIETKPLEEIASDIEAEENSTEIFSSGKGESLADFSSRILARANEKSTVIMPAEGDTLARARVLLAVRQTPLEKIADNHIPREIRKRKRTLPGAMRRAKVRADRGLRAGGRSVGRRVSSAATTVRATGVQAREAVKLKAVTLGTNAGAQIAATASRARRRAAQISLPASHIRAGDTFDGTTVRAIEARSDGKLKISYQAEQNGPVLSTVVDAGRSMRIDRKTRQQAFNSRIAAKASKPIARTREFANSMVASPQQVELFRKANRGDLRFSSIERSLRKQQRASRERALIAKLRELRSGEPQKV